MSWKPRQFITPPQTASNHFTNNSQQILHNGAVRNEFQNFPKQTNLSNTVAEKMIRNNERTSSAVKEVVWPPPYEETDMGDYQNNNDYSDFQNSQVTYNGGLHKKSTRKFQPPPTTIPLRASPPITQAAAPIYKSQPVTNSYQGIGRMRGDQKWPPPEYKAQIQAENEARISLAQGAQFRPLKVKKDYGKFFAKNALPNTYPGYKAPPGTQHYIEDGVTYY